MIVTLASLKKNHNKRLLKCFIFSNFFDFATTVVNFFLGKKIKIKIALKKKNSSFFFFFFGGVQNTIQQSNKKLAKK